MPLNNALDNTRCATTEQTAMLTFSHLSVTPSRAVTPPRSEEEFAILWINSEGLIEDCNPALESLTGYPDGELVSQPVSAVLPQLSISYLFQDGSVNPLLDFLTRIGHHFQALKRNGEAFDAEVHFMQVLSGSATTVKLLVKPFIEPPVRRSIQPA